MAKVYWVRCLVKGRHLQATIPAKTAAAAKEYVVRKYPDAKAVTIHDSMPIYAPTGTPPAAFKFVD